MNFLKSCHHLLNRIHIDITHWHMCLTWVRCQYLKRPLFRFYSCFAVSQVLPDQCRHRQTQTQIDVGTDRSGTDMTLLFSVSSVSSKQLTHIVIQKLGACPLARQSRRLACRHSNHSSELRCSCGCFKVRFCHIIQFIHFPNSRRLACCRSTTEEAHGR